MESERSEGFAFPNCILLKLGHYAEFLAPIWLYTSVYTHRCVWQAGLTSWSPECVFCCWIFCYDLTSGVSKLTDTWLARGDFEEYKWSRLETTTWLSMLNQLCKMPRLVQKAATWSLSNFWTTFRLQKGFIFHWSFDSQWGSLIYPLCHICWKVGDLRRFSWPRRPTKGMPWILDVFAVIFHAPTSQVTYRFSIFDCSEPRYSRMVPLSGLMLESLIGFGHNKSIRTNLLLVDPAGWYGCNGVDTFGGANGNCCTSENEHRDGSFDRKKQVNCT